MMTREQVTAFIKQYYHRTGGPPSVRCILKSLGLNRQNFYREFTGGLDQACRSAGVESARTKAMVEKALAARRVQVEQDHRASNRRRYQEEVRGYSDMLLEMEYAARLDSTKISQFASEVLPKIDTNLWRRFRIMSGGDMEKAYREAVSLCGEYIDRVKRKIAEGIAFRDDGRAYRSYLTEITLTWLVCTISEGRATLLAPGRADSRCPNCDTKLEYCSDGSIKCPSCKGKWRFTCDICLGEMRFREATKLLECAKCRYRLKFEEVLHELDEAYCKTALSNYLRTGREDPRFKNYEIVYHENGPNGTRITIPVRDLLQEKARSKQF